MESIGVRFHRDASRILRDRNEECIQNVYYLARKLFSSYHGDGFIPPPAGIELDSFSSKLRPLIEFTIDDYMEANSDFFAQNIRNKTTMFARYRDLYNSHLNRISACYYQPNNDLVGQEQV